MPENVLVVGFVDNDEPVSMPRPDPPSEAAFNAQLDAALRVGDRARERWFAGVVKAHRVASFRRPAGPRRATRTGRTTLARRVRRSRSTSSKASPDGSGSSDEPHPGRPRAGARSEVVRGIGGAR